MLSSPDCDSQLAWLPVCHGDVELGSGEHLEVVELAGEAMRGADWEEEVAETVFLLALRAWETHCTERCQP